eukprot:gene19556-25456_t
MSKKKVLLMGKSGAGKTSMRSIIFANFMAKDTTKLTPTHDVEHTQVRFLGDLENDISLFDGILEAMEQNSPDASIFALIHKMDLVNEEDKERAYTTSIWDETLYRAWSQIVYSLIPNVQVLESQLRDFCSISGADEVVLFERATFLVIANISTDVLVRNSQFTAIIDQFTGNTYMMVIMIGSSSKISTSLTQINIAAARKHFEKFIPENN